MMPMNRKKRKSVILALLVIALTVFIFSNSLTVGEESAEQSGKIVEFVKSVLAKMGISPNWDNLSFIVRKLAHFSEYFLLSATVTGFILSLTPKKRFIPLSPVYCFIVAVCDEFICQRITPGRGPKWTDVLIDSCGAVFAVLVFMAVYALIKYRNNSKGEKQ